MKQHLSTVLLTMAAIGGGSLGCGAGTAPGDPDRPRKTAYSPNEIEDLKAEGVSASELRNMGIEVAR
ncbi:hypothetical protein EC9_07530 [Rosistilla ulvae]|uniref:Uncharacterized protein n=1 Tax=Rosistilla ulvae TaxID=1930277 RepID=A0A517LVD7_9BACT|nr:hypothetical protein [Rosistilla ulvae]QDS86586.1 hypothetical protein EC9_07530 [Rosistilla ulvae]